MGLVSFAISGQALAACDMNAPANDATVGCTGTDTTGISGGANNVSVNIAGTINTTGTDAIVLGTGASIFSASGSSIISDQTAINIGGGSVYVNGTISGGNGTAIVFGAGGGNLSLYSTSNIVGNVLATSSASDVFRLRGTSDATLNVSEIGTKYQGFESFQKNDSSTWTLTGSTTELTSWNITGGALRVSANNSLGAAPETLS